MWSRAVMSALWPGEDHHLDEVAEVLHDLLRRRARGAADLLRVPLGQLRVEVGRDRRELLREPLQLLRQERSEDDPADGVALVQDGLRDVAAAGEAVEHPLDPLLGERIVLHAADGGHALLAPRALGPDVAAEVGVADLHVDQLVPLGVEDLEPDPIQLHEGLADVGEGPQVEQITQRARRLEHRGRQAHAAGPSGGSCGILVPRTSTLAKIFPRNSRSEIPHF